MTQLRRFGLRLAFAVFLLANSSTGQELKKETYWFLYEVHHPGHIELCDGKSCSVWQPGANFFRSGSIIRLRVIHAKFRSTFKVVVNGITVADAGPQIRGIPTVAALPGSPPPAPLPPPLPAIQATSQLELKALIGQYNKTAEAIAKAKADLSDYLGTYLGPSLLSPTGDCSPRITALPTSTVGDIANFALQLEADAQVCDNTGGKYFDNEDAFNNLTDRADRLIQSITLVKAVLPAQPDVTNARTQWEIFQGVAARFEQTFPNAARDPSTSESVAYVSSGTRYESLLNKEKEVENATQSVPQGLKQINKSASKAFAYINALYDISESSHPFEVPIGQYNSNYVAGFSIYEVASPVAYSLAPAKPASTSDQANPKIPPAPIPDPFGSSEDQPRSLLMEGAQNAVLVPVTLRSESAMWASPFPAGTKKSPASDDTQQNANPGKLVYSDSFDVHKIYRGNLVAGFFVSSLHNNPFGLTNNGQASSGMNVTFVTVTGPPYRPQFHAFAGINVYFWPRDVFPGQLSKDKIFPRNPKLGWLNGYWKPGILFGYGLDALNNYLVGLNWETKWGINIGGGGHIGQEARLQPGIIPGITQLPSAATSAPTYNKTEYGYYGSVGFDLAVMKNAIGQLFGGGSATGK